MDIQGHAYPDAYQTLFFAQRLGDMSIQQAQAAGDNSGDADGMPQSLLQAPPVLAAASWRVQASSLPRQMSEPERRSGSGAGSITMQRGRRSYMCRSLPPAACSSTCTPPLSTS